MSFLRKLFSPRHPHQYFFLHIPKTAGTSFRHMLVRDVFPHKDDVLPNKKEFKKRLGRYYRITELMELPPHRIQSCKLLSGHVPAVTRDLFASPPKMLLFLKRVLAGSPAVGLDGILSITVFNLSSVFLFLPFWRSRP